MGVIEEEALYDMKGEHVRALGTVWLGLTTGLRRVSRPQIRPLLSSRLLQYGRLL